MLNDFWGCVFWEIMWIIILNQWISNCHLYANYWKRFWLRRASCIWGKRRRENYYLPQRDNSQATGFMWWAGRGWGQQTLPCSFAFECHPGRWELRVNHFMTLHTDESLRANTPKAVHSLIYMVSGAIETKMGFPPLLGSSLSMQAPLRWATLYNTLRDEEPYACVLQVSKETRKERPAGWGEEPRSKQIDNLLIISSYPFMEQPTVDKVSMQTQCCLITYILQRKKPRLLGVQVI